MKKDFRDTHIGEVFEQTKHDLTLIQANIERREFDLAVQGMDWQIESFTKLRDNMKRAFSYAPNP